MTDFLLLSPMLLWVDPTAARIILPRVLVMGVADMRYLEGDLPNSALPT